MILVRHISLRFGINYIVIFMKKKTSIIILTYNNLALTKDCIESIRKYTEKDTYEIIVVDNCSQDETPGWLKAQSDLHVIFNQENVGFPKGCNIGIASSSKENDILLLNNDTIVTTNWLSNLQECLYSDEKIGAVGAVSNHGANLQACEFTYENFDEMQEKALKNNISDSSRWEEKICLIGYCMLIKREVIDELGGLNEGYTPGYIEDNDLSLRIVKLGYKLYLCHDAFIHHYLGTAFRKDEQKFNRLILKNRDYFEKKWNFDVFSFDHSKNLSIFLGREPQEILDYHSEIGASLLRIRYLFPNAHVVGVESDSSKFAISKLLGEVTDDIKKIPKNSFDTIFIGNVLEEVEKPLFFIHELKEYLKPGGYIIGEFSNINNIENICLLFKNSWYYQNFQKQNHFTKSDISKMFLEEGYIDGYFYPFSKEFTDEEKDVLKKFSLSEEVKNIYYSFRFQKGFF